MRCIIARFPFELTKSDVQAMMRGVKPEAITGETVIISR
ncbi:MAG TPA: SCO5918 family protein, partial [Streptomyces sp.]